MMPSCGGRPICGISGKNPSFRPESANWFTQ
jgi:hypothetical protein